MKNFLTFKYFKNDLLGGITAGIVALPLALAFGEQSGMGAAAGLYGAAFIAFFAAMFGGTSTQISGPTAPMTALSMIVVSGLIQASEGRLEQALPLILMVFLLAGVFQVLMGMVKFGAFIKYIPYTVVSGFMTGIGVIILITQIPATLGYNPAKDNELVERFIPQAEELMINRLLEEESEGLLKVEDIQNVLRRSEALSEEDIMTEAIILATVDAKGVKGSIKYMSRAISQINIIELSLALLTIIIIYGFRKITKALPSTLVALLIVSLGAFALNLDYVLIREIPMGLPVFHLDIFAGFNMSVLAPYFITALLLALLGAIDSLLTSVVADNMTKTQHDPNRELVGQGIGNSIAALFGGLPGAGATIRTVVNIQAGGKTKLSGMISGVLLFVILIMLGPLASKIPAAVLAGILITVGIGVMDYKGLKALPTMERSAKVILLTVLILTVFWQLVYAVAVGLVLASAVFLKRMSDISAKNLTVSTLSKIETNEPLWEDESKVSPEIREKVMFKHLNGPLFFGVVTHFKTLVSNLNDIHLLVIRMERVPYMDLSGFFALENVIEDMRNQDVVVAITGCNDQVMKMFERMKAIPSLLPEHLVFKDFEDCRLWMREILAKEDGLNEEIRKMKSEK